MSRWEAGASILDWVRTRLAYRRLRKLSRVAELSEAYFGETPKPTRETRALPGKKSHFVALNQVSLFAHPISLSKPSFHLGIDVIRALEPEGVQMISRRENLDAAKTGIVQAAREHDVTINPVPSDNERGETHSHLKRNSCFLGEHGDRPVFPGNALQLSENLPDLRRLSLEVRSKRVIAARMGLIPICELAAAFRAPPHR
jgi:hypothetical protein